MIELECGLLFSMMKNAQAFLEARVKIPNSSSFSDPNAKEIFDTLILMADEGQPFDEPIIKSKLSESAKKFYDENIKWSFADPKLYETYIEKIADNQKLQSLGLLGAEIQESIQKGASLIEVLSIAEDKILSIANKTIGSDMVLLEEAIVEYEARVKAGKKQGISLTIPRLDELTNGLSPGQLIIVAGRPAMGKSAFAMQIAYNNALKNNVPFGVILLEMSNEELLERLIANIANIESWKLRTGKLSTTDWQKFNKFKEDFKKSQFYFEDAGSMNVNILRAKAKRLKMKNKNLGGLVVDYLQLMDSNSPKNRVEEVSEISRGLKILAKELEIPIIAVSQLSRKVEDKDRKDKRPFLSDLRESGSIEQDADLVLMLYREDYYTGEVGNESVTEIIIAKQRNGPISTVKTIFNKEHQRFIPIAAV